MHYLLPVLVMLFITVFGVNTSLAGVQVRVAEIGLPSAVVSAKSSEDGKILVVQQQTSGENPGGLQIVDIADPDQPRLRGFVRYGRSGELVVSPDGRRAMLAVADETKKYEQATKYRVAIFDLSSPDAPQIAEEHAVEAVSVVLADDASAYAISFRDADSKSGGRKWRTIVRWADGKRKDVSLVEEGYAATQRKLSVGGNFLAIRGYGEIIVYRVDPDWVSLYNQESGYAERYRCLLTVLPTGHVVVQNSQFGYLESLIFEGGLPRSHRVRVQEEFCSHLGGTASVAYYHAYPGHVIRLRADRRGVLSIDGDWWFSSEHVVVAATQNLVFTVSKASKHLEVYRLDVTKAEVDWQGLEAKHREILDVYREARVAKKYSADLDAFDQFVEAGAVAAIEADLLTITPKRAAALLNDFGFFASNLDRHQLAERALRRAIALNPGRASAHLNLADLLRKRLGKSVSHTVSRSLVQDVQRHYRSYLAAGGQRTEAISKFLRNDLDAKNGNLCETIANFSNAGRLDELVSSAGIGIPLPGGRKIDIAFTTEGTAHVPTYAIYDTATGFPLNAPSEVPVLAQFPEGLWGGDHLGLLIHKDAVHVLHYRDMAHPVSTVALSGSDSSCQFKVETTEIVGHKALEPALCRDIQRWKSREQLVFAGLSLLSDDEVRKHHPESFLVGTILVDVANDGNPVNVGEFKFSSGAGAGCEATFYNLLDRHGKAFSGDAKRDVLMALQDGDVSARYPAKCGNDPQFFFFNGKVYFETKPRVWPPIDQWDMYHRVVRAEGGKVVDVCNFEFSTKVRWQ